MPPGPKPKPTAIKDQQRPVRSTRAKSKIPPAAPVILVGGEKPPAWLKGEGLAEWNRLAPILVQVKLLSVADVGAFARYCRNFALWLKLRKEMDDEGATYESESNHGKLKRAHPAFLIADRVERQLLASEDRFGLNPAERQRLFATRAQTGQTGDLFQQPAEPKREDDAAAKPAAAARPITSPIGGLTTAH